MAKTNKYTSLNFNDIYEKKIINPTKQPSSSFTNPNKPIISNSRIHGGMLVLTRPSPKPISQPSLPPPSPAQPPVPDPTRSEPDSISLRPLGRTGSGQSISSSPLKLDKELPKPDRFVPPHLRPGFVAREERLLGEVQKQPPGVRARELGGHRQGHFGSPNRYGEDGRPKSGGGYERMRRVGESDLGEMNRPGSREIRPSSSG